MGELTPPPLNSSPARELATAVAQVSVVFARLFGARWREQGSDPKTLSTWERAFQHAGLRPEQIRRGLAAAALRDWPPTCGEFVALCRDPVPPVEVAMAEAARWAHSVETHDGTWSHPAIGAAARKVGDYQLRHLDERTLRRRFEAEYREAVEAAHRGAVLDLPKRRLAHDPKPGPQSAEQKARAQALITDLAQHLGMRRPA